MLLYISSNENIGIFDFLADEQGMIIKKFSGLFFLKQFVIQDMRSLNHYAHLAIDLSALKDTQDEIIEAIIAFKSMYTSRIIFYIDEIKKEEAFVQKLMEQEIYNIVSSEEVSILNEQINKATSQLGMNKRDIQLLFNYSDITHEVFTPTYSFPLKNIKIAITGVAQKVGTTTMAMNLCHYLSNIGAKVCYVEANQSAHLRNMVEYYPQMIEQDHSATCNGICFLELNTLSEEEYDFVIYDMGVVDNKIIGAIKNKIDVGILCATGKPYEFKDYEKISQLFEGIKITRIFSFVPLNEQLWLTEKYGDVFYSEYTPCLFDSEKNSRIWQWVLSNYILKKAI